MLAALSYEKGGLGVQVWVAQWKKVPLSVGRAGQRGTHKGRFLDMWLWLLHSDCMDTGRRPQTLFVPEVRSVRTATEGTSRAV